MLIKQSTARNRMVFMTDSADHVSGKASLTLTITASKDGAAFGSISPSVTDRGSGWYSLALTTSHTDTLGDLALHITGTGADPSDLVDQVVVLLPGDSVTVGTNSDKTGYSLAADQAVNVTKVNGTTQTARDLGAQLDATITSRMATYTQPTGFLAATFPSGTIANTTNITAGTITTTTNLTNLPSIPANWITAAGITAAALNGKGDWNIGKTGYSLTQTFPTNFSSLSIDASGRVDVIKVAGTTQTARDLGAQLDVAVSTRMATFTYTVPPTVADITSGVWDEPISGHLTAGTTGAKLNSAGGSSDPWSTALPGAYGAGTAGNILGNTLPASSYVAPDNTGVAAIKSKTDNLPSDPASESNVSSRLAASAISLNSGRVDVGRMNGTNVQGTGQASDLWRG